MTMDENYIYTHTYIPIILKRHASQQHKRIHTQVTHISRHMLTCRTRFDTTIGILYTPQRKVNDIAYCVRVKDYFHLI
jgi:hypothetical protein